MNGLNPGPFAPLVGYVSALLATVYLVGVLWRGGKARWIAPEENLPKTAGRIVGVLCGIGIVWLWLYAEPATIGSVLRIAFVSGVILVLSFLVYWFLNGALVYYREVPVSESAAQRESVVGGFWLTARARAVRRRKNETVQSILEGAAYNVDAVWSRVSRELAKVTLLLLFLVVMVSGTVAISAAGFAMQVQLTNQPASAVIRAEDAPGSDADDVNR
jgi:hypothetical protein